MVPLLSGNDHSHIDRDQYETADDDGSSAYRVAKYSPTTPTSVQPVALTASINSRSLQLNQPHQWARFSWLRRLICSSALVLTLWPLSSCLAPPGSWPRARPCQRHESPPASLVRSPDEH